MDRRPVRRRTCSSRLLGLRETRWADLELTASWRQFLDDPASFLRHLD